MLLPTTYLVMSLIIALKYVLNITMVIAVVLCVRTRKTESGLQTEMSSGNTTGEVSSMYTFVLLF